MRIRPSVRLGSSWVSCNRALSQVRYKASPALACIIGARRAWTVEMISSEKIPCR